MISGNVELYNLDDIISIGATIRNFRIAHKEGPDTKDVGKIVK